MPGLRGRQLHVAVAANLKQFGAYCGQQHDKRSLGSAHYSALLAELADELACGKYDKYIIKFFGAEPLTRWQNVAQFMQSCKELAAGCGKDSATTGEIVTSGYLLSEHVHKRLRESGIREFEITLDGRGPIHDARRPLKNGSPTFARIVDNLLLAKDSMDHGTFKIRVNVDERNYDHIEALVEYLHEVGVIPWAQLYIASVRNWGSQRAGEFYSDARRFAQLEIRVYSQLFSFGMCPELLPLPKKRTCVALADRPAVIAPNGERYLCTEVPLSERGSGSGSEWTDIDIEEWKRGIVAGRYPCASCALLPICGGSCPKAWLKAEVPCPPFKWNIGQRIQMFAAYYPEHVVDL